MASVSSPYGLRPINMIGSQPFNGGGIREIKLSTNNSAAIYTGDVIVLTSAGNPAAASTTPTGPKYPATAADATAGVVGVCVGVRYALPSGTLGYPLHSQYLPANAITAGYTDVWVKVMDDPDALFQIQGSAAFGSLTNGAHGAVGKNAALGNFGGSATTGLSTVNLVVGTNGGSLAATSTLAMRIVGVVPGTESDAYPEIIVKFNAGVHSYYNPLGV